MKEREEEILRAAIRLERDGREFYLKAAEKASGEATRKALASLAEDERRHIEWIENLSDGGIRPGDANRALYEELRPIFAEPSQEGKEGAEAAPDDIRALTQAIGIEEKAEAAYRKWGEEAEEESIRSLCGTLADVERFHRQLIQNTIEYLQSPDQWFMGEERWSFDGG